MVSNYPRPRIYGQFIESEKPDLDFVARSLGIDLPLRRRVVRSPFYPTSEDSLRSLLKVALTHSSYINEHPEEDTECNERLEFLGDAVLGLVVANELYTKYPDLQEGALTQIRANVVNATTLARVARDLKLGEHLLMGSGEEKTGGRNRNSNLAATFEAIVGAIFCDKGFQPASEFCARMLGNDIDSAHRKITSAPNQVKSSDNLGVFAAAGKHPKSALQEISQAMYGELPVYRITEAIGKGNAMTFTAQVQVNGKMLGSGCGTSKKAAETAAAKIAIDTLAATE